MKKRFEISEYFAGTFEPSVQVLDLEHRSSHTKVASEAWEYIKNVKTQEGKRYILVIAMGAGEYWGSNKNGDYFPEADLLHCYKHFETTFDSEGKINGGALIYKHHRNKLAQGHPWFGVVKKAFYNHRMHRVELLLEIHGDKGQDIIDRVDKGETIAVSMGVRIPYDTCSICANKAKTREQYCEHLRDSLRQILPDGRMVYAINGGYDYNLHPKALNFFDISVVFRPADQTGYMLKKVAFAHGDDEDVIGSAELYEQEADTDEKIAFLRKLSTIDKIVKGIPVAVKDDNGELRAIKAHKPTIEKIVGKMKPLARDTVEQLSAFPMKKVLATLSHHGVLLTTPEFVNLVIRKLTGKQLAPHLLQEIADLQGEIFEKLSNHPEKFAELEAYEMFQPERPDSRISEVLEPLLDSRDLTESGIVKKAAVDLARSVLDIHDRQFPWGDNKGMLHTETVTDPKTGKTYQVSMTAVEDAQFWHDLTTVGKAVMSSALLGGVYAYLEAKKSKLAPIAGVAALAMGASGIRDLIERDSKSRHIMTNEGTPIPEETVMLEKKSGLFKHKEPTFKQKLNKKLRSAGDTARIGATFGPIAATKLLSSYYQDRLESGRAGTYSTDLEKHLDDAGRWAHHHPLLLTGGAVVGSHAALNTASHFRRKLLG